MTRNSVDTHHGLSTRHAEVMENSRGKSRRRDGALENSVRRRSRGEEERGCVVNESRESASAPRSDGELLDLNFRPNGIRSETRLLAGY